MGNLLAVSVHTANIHDTVFGLIPAAQAYESYPSLQRFCGDEGYRKTFENDVLEELGLGVDISKKIDPKFAVIPKRWVSSVLSHGWVIPADWQRIMKSVPIIPRPWFKSHTFTPCLNAYENSF